MRHIAIIGGGYSGVAAAVHLVRQAGRPVRVSIVDQRSPGPGFSHSSPDPDHRLNGPDTIHLLYPECTDHFAQWLRSSGTLERDPEAIAPSGLVFPRRADFGRYVGEQLREHGRSNPSGSSIEYLRGTAIDVRPTSSAVDIQLKGGSHILADVCILATGWDTVSTPAPFRDLAESPSWIANPWDLQRRAMIPSAVPVLVVGAGLTASDVVVSLLRQRHQGAIVCMSRHGLRPATQNPHRGGGSFWERMVDPLPPFIRRHGVPASLLALIRAFRSDARSVDQERSSWHVPFDEMRDSSTLYWPKLSLEDRRRFVRHLKPWYDAYRYRNPPQTEAIIDKGIRSGQVAYVRCRAPMIERNAYGLCVRVVDGMAGRQRLFQFAFAINCTGPQTRPSACNSPLLHQLEQSGVISDSSCGIGIEVNGDCRPVGHTGRVAHNLFVLGPATSGSLGETTAVPFITRQVVQVVPKILEQLQLQEAEKADVSNA